MTKKKTNEEKERMEKLFEKRKTLATKIKKRNEIEVASLNINWDKLNKEREEAKLKIIVTPQEMERVILEPLIPLDEEIAILKAEINYEYWKLNHENTKNIENI